MYTSWVHLPLSHNGNSNTSTFTCIVEEGERRDKGPEKLFEEVRLKSSLTGEGNRHLVAEVQKFPNKLDSKIHTRIYIIDMAKVKGRILKTLREK